MTSALVSFVIVNLREVQSKYKSGQYHVFPIKTVHLILYSETSSIFCFSASFFLLSDALSAELLLQLDLGGNFEINNPAGFHFKNTFGQATLLMSRTNCMVLYESPNQKWEL